MKLERLRTKLPSMGKLRGRDLDWCRSYRSVSPVHTPGSPLLLDLFRALLPQASTGTPRPACDHSEYHRVEPSRLSECVSVEDILQLTDTSRLYVAIYRAMGRQMFRLLHRIPLSTLLTIADRPESVSKCNSSTVPNQE